LHRFVPAFASRRAATGQPLDAEFDGAVSGVVFVADIAGFSVLTERLAKSGQAGIEELQAILNACFERIVSTIEDGGGEVYKFAGDATMAWWPAADGRLRDMTLAAAATALRLQALVPEIARQIGAPLSLRIGIGAGPLYTALLGGTLNRWEVVLGGEALDQAARLQAVPSGQVALSEEAWRLIGSDCSAEPLAGGGFAVQGVSAPVALAPASSMTGASSEQLAPLVQRHLLASDANGQPQAWAELRSASVVFAITRLPAELKALQDTTAAMQEAVYGTGGSVLQCLVDDKADFVMVAAWGVPGSSYPDDAERAVRAAHALAAARPQAAGAVSVGVASGRTFAGLRGSTTRAEYALIGAVVNLAARLAQSAHGRVLCDATTARAVPAIAFEALPELMLKGISGVTAHESLGHRRAAGVNVGTLVGREVEQAQLLGLLQDLDAASRRSLVVVIEGEAGIGKSHLCEAFARAAVDRGLVVAQGAGDPLDNSAAYRPLRRLFDTLLGLEMVAGTVARRDAVLAMLGDGDALQERASLLSNVLDLDLAPTPTEQQMSGRGRIEATTDLLLDLLRATHSGSTRVLMLEDLQWLDSASWSVLEAAARRCHGLLLVLNTRPLDVDSALNASLRELDAVRIRLQPLGEAAVRDVIASELGAQTVPEPLLRAVADKTQGLPLFVRQVVAALVAGKVVQCSHGVVSFDARALAALSIPDTLQGAVVSRIDRLTPRQQHTLKTASVIGRSFAFDALCNLNAGQWDAQDLRADLAVLVDLGLVERESDHLQFRFSHALICDALYGLLPLGHRRELHASLGGWYERHGGDSPLMLSRIALHWEQAQDAVRAVRAMELAGNHALRTGAYREAQSIFSRLIDICTVGFGEGATAPAEASVEQRARWQLHLGQACYDLGELERARDALETAARLLGHPVPAQASIGWVLLTEVLKIFLRRRLPHPRPPSDLAPALRARQLATVMTTLGRIYHLTQRPRHTVYAIVRRFNLLEPHPPSPEQIGACGAMMYLASVAGRSQAAEGYAARVTELHRRLQDPLAYAEANLTVALSRLGQGQWQACESSAIEAEQIFHRLGERQSRMTVISMRANAAELQGHFDAARRLWVLEMQLAEQSGQQLVQCWALGGLAMLEIRTGNHVAAADHAARARVLAKATGESVSYLADSGLLALALLEQGDTDGARNLLDEGLSIMAGLPRSTSAHHLLNGLDTFSELIMRFWEQEAPVRGSAAWKLWAQRAALAVSCVRGYARQFAIGIPMALQWRANASWLTGRHAQALVLWRQAVSEGQRLGIPYETAKAHLQLARRLDARDPQRALHAREAGALFEKLGSRHGVAQARALSGA
jgi:class 3 adenylate cyclase/tetratricopeptide (TPR) repeat protein